jgi:Leucine-rich repeat (LRR) protein
MITIARPFWRSRIQMKLNLGLIQRFSLVDTMKFRSLCCLPSVIPHNSFKSFKHLTSLSIVNCRLPNNDYRQSDSYLDGSTLKTIGQLRKLKKLDLDHQLITVNNLELLSGLVSLTQLRISFSRRTNSYQQQLQFDFLSGLTNLRKLS